jgi:hypothetical protein
MKKKSPGKAASVKDMKHEGSGRDSGAGGKTKNRPAMTVLKKAVIAVLSILAALLLFLYRQCDCGTMRSGAGRPAAISSPAAKDITAHQGITEATDSHAVDKKADGSEMVPETVKKQSVKKKKSTAKEKAAAHVKKEKAEEHIPRLADEEKKTGTPVESKTPEKSRDMNTRIKILTQ